MVLPKMVVGLRRGEKQRERIFFFFLGGEGGARPPGGLLSIKNRSVTWDINKKYQMVSD
jgi:hypothetical protein